ncbi:MAG: YCF48-related protein [Saprospiraceae bacterium]|nr:YCF48-related protein [Saprospiraceae bacterium]
MNYRHPLFFLFLLIVSSCSSEDEPEVCVGIESSVWEVIQSMTENNLTDVDFYGDEHGVISGTFGTVLTTTDGGINWIQRDIGQNQSFVKAFILNENELYTSRLGIFKSSDGGETFSELGDLSTIVSTIFDLHFMDSQNGYLIRSGKVLGTSDGGQTWTEKSIDVNGASKMQFVSANTGYVWGGSTNDGFSSGVLYTSENGGESWTLLSEYDSEVITMHFVNNDMGYLSTIDRTVMQTMDAGITWTIQAESLSSLFRDMVFINECNGYAVSAQGIHKTEDGGITWKLDYETEEDGLTAMEKTENNMLIAVGRDGLILRTQL